MESNAADNNKMVPAAIPAERIVIELQYLNADQARCLIKMFDSPEAYAENFSAIKAITRGLFKALHNTNQKATTPIVRIFNVVNSMQDTLMLDDMQENERILNASGLMPDWWYGFGYQKGGSGC